METISRFLLVALLILISMAVLAYLAAFLTGRTERAYPVLNPADSITVGGEQVSVASLAERYKPVMRLKTGNPSPPLLSVFFEVVDNSETWDIVYYFNWEDEINPNPVIHWFYRLFRGAYYGIPIRDIEFFQVGVDKQTGAVSTILFETSPGDDYFVVLSVHWIARYSLSGTSTYELVLTNKDSAKQIDLKPGIQPWFDGNHTVVEVATWNHLTRMASRIIEAESAIQDAPLTPLSAEEYRSYKFARKSQGDHKTQEKPVERAIGKGGAYMLGIVTGLWIARLFY